MGPSDRLHRTAPQSHTQDDPSPTDDFEMVVDVEPGVYHANPVWSADGGSVLTTQIDRKFGGELLSVASIDIETGTTTTPVTDAIKPVVVFRYLREDFIRTVLPGHIEMARYNATFGPRHIHIAVSHPEHPRLISLIFFTGDERLEGTPYPELAIPP